MNNENPCSPVGDLLQSEFHQELRYVSPSASCKHQTLSENEYLKPESINLFISPTSPTCIESRITNNDRKSMRRFSMESLNYEYPSITSHQISSRGMHPWYSDDVNNRVGSLCSSISTPTLSHLDDPIYSPPPMPPYNADVMQIVNLSQREVIHSPLPSFDKITHSGHVMARISLKSLVFKKWNQVFWISYSDTQVLIFRSKCDFEEWATNPHLTTIEREELVKLNINFKECHDYQHGVRCYRVFGISSKYYGKSGMMHTFKIEKWTHNGPVILGAFASKIYSDVEAFSIICKEIMKRHKSDLSHFLSRVKDDDLSIQSAKSAPEIYPYQSVVSCCFPG